MNRKSRAVLKKTLKSNFANIATHSPSLLEDQLSSLVKLNTDANTVARYGKLVLIFAAATKKLCTNYKIPTYPLAKAKKFLFSTDTYEYITHIEDEDDAVEQVILLAADLMQNVVENYRE